jgi:hypothetical protein
MGTAGAERHPLTIFDNRAYVNGAPDGRIAL